MLFHYAQSAICIALALSYYSSATAAHHDHLMNCTRLMHCQVILAVTQYAQSANYAVEQLNSLLYCSRPEAQMLFHYAHSAICAALLLQTAQQPTTLQYCLLYAQLR